MLAWLNYISYGLKFPFVGSGDFKIYIYKEKETKGMKNEMKKKNNKGFSLVELIVVIAIMAVLMVVLAPAMLRYVEKSRIQKDASAVGEIINAANIALSDEKVNAAVSENTTIVISTGKIETTNDTNKELEKELHKSVDPSKVKFDSKQFEKMQYTIHIEKASDGTLQAEEYKGYVSEAEKGNWAEKPAKPAEPKEP